MVRSEMAANLADLTSAGWQLDLPRLSRERVREIALKWMRQLVPLEQCV